jgi:hypothetical protein
MFSLFPSISGAYTYDPKTIRGWVNSRGSERKRDKWNVANVIVYACRGQQRLAEATPDPVLEEGPLADGRRLFAIPDHGLTPREVLLEHANVLITLEGVDYGFVKLYSSEQIRLIHQVLGDDQL